MSESEETFDMRASQMAGPYHPLVFNNTPPDVGVARRLTCDLLNFWGQKSLSRREWQAAGPFELHSRAGTFRGSFDEVTSRLSTDRGLNLSAIPAESPNSNWTDSSVVMGQVFHAPSNQHERHMLIQLPQGLGLYAEAIPALDREGVAFSNVLLALQTRVVRLRTFLVDHSADLFNANGSWHDVLTGYLNACVSLVEATLSRIFHRTRHQGPSIGWKLEPACTSARMVPRDQTMFAWLSRVTGKESKDRCGDYPRFDRLREVRHHLQHFDPPAFAMTIEDAAEWLNLSQSVASLVLSIREAVAVPPSQPLVELMLAPTVAAVPRDPAVRRYPQPSNSGYRSCRVEQPLRG